jgi:hypothetical protein
MQVVVAVFDFLGLSLMQQIPLLNSIEGCHAKCHHPNLGDSPKFTFFSKIKKNQNQKNKIKAGNAEKDDQERLQK